MEPAKKTILMKEDLIQEIRINQKYANILYSDYDKSKKGDSIPKIRKKTIFTEDYASRFFPDTATIIPPNCRYIEKVNKGTLVVIEEPPAFRTIKASFNIDDELMRLEDRGKIEEFGYKDYLRKHRHPFKFMLAFPYVVFILYINDYNELNNSEVYIRVQQMSGMSDYLLKIPMLNISENQGICLGDSSSKRHRSLLHTIQNIIMVFWSAEFNTDYNYNYQAYREVSQVNTYLEWQYLSKENPMFIYDVDWIRLPYTIGEAIKRLKRNFHIPDMNRVGYHDLSQMFFTPIDTGKELKPYPRSRKKYKLFFDTAQGTYLDSNIFVHVGDPFVFKNGKICHIDSFGGFLESSTIDFIQIDMNGKKVIMKFTKELQKFLLEQTKKIRFAEEATLPNGVVIKPDDILTHTLKNGSKLFKKVNYIRRCRDNQLEVKLGADFYLVDGINNGKIIDVEAPDIFGLKLKKTEEYIYINQDGRGGSLKSCTMAKYLGIDVGRRNDLLLKFKVRGRSDPITMQFDKVYSSPPLYEKEALKSIPGIFRVGRKMLSVQNAGDRIICTDRTWKHDKQIIYNTANTRMLKPRAVDIQLLIKDDVFSITGPEYDVSFNIGDKVVVSNWSDPIKMLTIKTIQSFVFNKENGEISFALQDKKGNLSNEAYVSARDGIVYIGRIRKITNMVARLQAGTKIIANEASIPNFPKKDVNIIIGFLIDTGTEPLVLCSNCCTLWLTDVITKFKKVTMKAKRWKTLQHAPIDVSKIKFQAGDIVNGNADYLTKFGFILHAPSATRALRATPMEYYDDAYPPDYTFDRFFAKDCVLDYIPSPRIGPAKIKEYGVTPGYVNFHGSFVENRESRFSLINNREVLDVQSSRE
jgi:hypothetical protein